MSGVFISYRRDDTQGYASRLADDLAAALGPGHVFSDVEIPAGSDYVDVLHAAVDRCDALVVVVGRRWAAESMLGFPSRLFEPDDWVRTEIEAALTRDKAIVPVLVGGATMPAAQSLPPSIRPFVRRQAASLGDRHWNADVAQLVAQLRALLPGRLPQPAQPPAPPIPARRRRRSLLSILMEPLAHGAGRGIKSVLSLVLFAVLLYAGLRLFGDAATLRQLDAIDARLMLGWNRLLGLLNLR